MKVRKQLFRVISRGDYDGERVEHRDSRAAAEEQRRYHYQCGRYARVEEVRDPIVLRNWKHDTGCAETVEYEPPPAYESDDIAAMARRGVTISDD